MAGDRQLRVLHALRTADPAAGGFVTYLASLRHGLAGRPVELLTESVFPRNANWRVVALRRPLRFLGRVRRQLRSVEVLHVHGIFGWHVLLSVWAANASARPYAVTLHGHLHPDALRERRIGKRIYLALAGRRILEHASAVLVTAPAERDIVQAYSPGVRVEHVTPGLQPSLGPDSEAAPSNPARGRPLNVVYIGRLHPHKGLHLVVRSLGEASSRGLDAELTVAGSGRRRYRSAVGRMVEACGLAGRVHFLGHVAAEQRARLLGNADVFVLSSRSENFGFAAAEAMAAGVPVIVTESVGLAPLVARSRCGRIVPVDDVPALRQALLDYADPAAREADGRRAHATARAHFSAERMGAAVEQIYRDIADARDG